MSCPPGESSNSEKTKIPPPKAEITIGIINYTLNCDIYLN